MEQPLLCQNCGFGLLPIQGHVFACTVCRLHWPLVVVLPPEQQQNGPALRWQLPPQLLVIGGNRQEAINYAREDAWEEEGELLANATVTTHASQEAATGAQPAAEQYVDLFHDALATHPLQRDEKLHVTNSTSKDRPLQCF